MRLRFRTVPPDEVEKEVTQRDQFNSDEVELVEALIREAHQNSLDAQPDGSTRPVRTRIAFHSPSEEQRRFIGPLLAPLADHLAACGLDTATIDFANPRFLVIEDFETTGLTGAWDRKDNKPFSDFWRRVGKSHKGGAAGGRWGLGKLVFSSASQGRSVFGLTIRSDDPSRDALVMGQAVLTIHHDSASGKDVDGIGFFSEEAEDRLQIPNRDPGFVEKFAEATGMSRRGEPGLSLAIPFVRSDLKKEDFIKHLLRNYYFPLLMGQLTSEIEGTNVNAGTFDALAAQYGGDRLGDGRVVAFVRDLRAKIEAGKPHFTLTTSLAKGLAAGIADTVTQELRDQYAAGKMIHVRVPISLSHKKNGNATSHIDLFMRITEGDGQALVVRGGITLPQEATEFRSRKCFAALVATDDAVAEFLGDAENPAHTKWNRNAEKLAANWKNGATRLTEIRHSLGELYNLVAQALETIEPDAFLDIFSVPAAAGTQKPKPTVVSDPPPFPVIKGRPSPFDIRERKGGFAVVSTKALDPSDLPVRLRVDAAYDISAGNPFARHSDVDFDFRAKELEVRVSGGTYTATAANGLSLEILEPKFELDVAGFDANRDLVVRGRRVP